MRIDPLVPYGTYITCPLDECEWRLRTDDTGPQRWLVRDLTPEGISAGVAEGTRQRAGQTEREIREHLASHDPLDFLRTIAGLRQRLGQYEDVGWPVESNWPSSGGRIRL